MLYAYVVRFLTVRDKTRSLYFAPTLEDAYDVGNIIFEGLGVTFYEIYEYDSTAPEGLGRMVDQRDG